LASAASRHRTTLSWRQPCPDSAHLLPSILSFIWRAQRLEQNLEPSMDWKRLLAYITGSVEEELLLRKAYLRGAGNASADSYDATTERLRNQIDLVSREKIRDLCLAYSSRRGKTILCLFTSPPPRPPVTRGTGTLGPEPWGASNSRVTRPPAGVRPDHSRTCAHRTNILTPRDRGDAVRA
jgi:hypothetical protein